MKIIFALCFCTLIVLLSTILYYTMSTKGLIKEKVNLGSENNEMESYYFQNSIYQSIKNDNVNIEDLLPDVKTSFDFSKPILVCRFSALSCDICVNYVLDKLKEHFENVGSNKQIILIISGVTMVEKKGFENIVVLNNNVNLGLSTEKANVPFLFVLENGKTTHVFVPDKNFPKYTDIYLKEIKNRYFF